NTDGLQFLFRKNKIKSYRGTGRLKGDGTVQVTAGDGTVTEVKAKNIIIATGSSVAPLRGVEPDGTYIGTSEEALEYDEVPERLVVVGAGAIGLELGSVWNRLCADATVVEYLDRILPGMDLSIAMEAQRSLRRQALTFRLRTGDTAATVHDTTLTVTLTDDSTLECDRLLIAVGRVPNTAGLGLEEAGVETDGAGHIRVDGQFRTNVPGVLAIGDVIEGPMLAHKASDDGVAAVEFLAGQQPQVDYSLIPAIVYTA